MSKDPKAVAARFVDEFQTKGDVGVARELLSDTLVNHSPPPGMAGTAEDVIQFFGALRQAFPDFRAEIHDQIAEGDKVVTRKTFVGTHRGEFFGIPGTGKEISIGVIDIVRVKDGKIVEHWNQVEMLGVMQQLGALPT